VVISGGLVRQSVLSPGVRVNSWATVERSVLLHNTKIGRHAVVRDAIIDKNVTVPEWAQVGVDKDRDRARAHLVSLFDILPPRDPRVTKARSTLSALLF